MLSKTFGYLGSDNGSNSDSFSGGDMDSCSNFHSEGGRGCVSSTDYAVVVIVTMAVSLAVEQIM